MSVFFNTTIYEAMVVLMSALINLRLFINIHFIFPHRRNVRALLPKEYQLKNVDKLKLR